jgi:hypothetical protein
MDPTAAHLLLAEPFRTLAELRRAHTGLLRDYHAQDDAERPAASLIVAIEEFLRRGASSGALLDLEEDRADAQVLLNYWTTVLYAAGVAAPPALLADPDPAAVEASVGVDCPYPGLSPFLEEEAPVFFGRRELVRRMCGVLASGRFLAVVGLSGSGKSSVVRAGLLPELRQGGQVEEAAGWRYLRPLVPGTDPLGSLARATCPEGVALGEWRAKLARRPDALVEVVTGEVPAGGDAEAAGAGGGTASGVGTSTGGAGASAPGAPAVLIVDQLEELFTIAAEPAERARFVDHLVALASAAGPSHRVVVTLRSDFEPRLGLYPKLQALFTEAATARVPPLDPSGLRVAIVKPAARRGVGFESGLVEELVQQVLGEPAGLPLLQFTLRKLWALRAGRVIPWSAYRDLGGNVREILARSADATYESFALHEDRAVVAAVFKLLVEPGPGGEVTSHRLPRARLRAIEAAGDRVERVVERLLADGLLRRTPGASAEDEHLEVTHEALIRNWPRLVDWVTDERQRQRKRLQLAADAEAWEAHGRDKSGLLSGVRLAEAQEYTDRTPLEDELVAESLDAVRDTKRRLWQGVAAVLALGVVLLGALLWQSIRASSSAAAVVAEREERERQEAIAEAEFERAQGLAVVWQLFAARPVIDLKGGEFTAPEGWEMLASQQSRVAAVAAAVGAVISEDPKSVSTGFLVAPGVVLAFGGGDGAPRWVDLGDDPALGSAPLDERRLRLDAPERRSSNQGLRSLEQAARRSASAALLQSEERAPRSPSEERRPNVLEAPARLSSRDLTTLRSPQRFAVEEVLGEWQPEGFGGGRLLLLRLAKVSTAGQLPPPPVTLAARPHTEAGTPLYTIGYPMRDSSNPAEVVDYMLRGRDGVKRLQPGYLLSVDAERRVLQHDCFTLPGNAGSPIVELATGRVIGLHFGGQLATKDGPGIKEAVALWFYAGDSVLRRAGVRFE